MTQDGKSIEIQFGPEMQPGRSHPIGIPLVSRDRHSMAGQQTQQPEHN